MYPKLVEIGSFFLPTYGALVALAFLVSIALTARLGDREGLDKNKIYDLAIYTAIAGMVGAKLFMFLFDWRYFIQHPGEFFSLNTMMAAGVYQGGLILALLTAIWFMRRSGLPGLKTADVFAPGVAIGHAVGRLGCFSAGCCWGVPTADRWAVRFVNPDAHALTGVPLGVYMHPTQLYEAGSELLIFFVVLWFLGRRHKDGAVIGLYLVLYSIARFLVEFVRHHDQALILDLSLTQWISIATFLAGVVLLVRPGRKPKAIA